MKLIVVAALLVVAVGLGGCSTAPYARGEAASSGLVSAARSLEAADRSLDAALASLRELGQGEGDLRARFNGFSRSLDNLASSANSVRGEAEAIRTEGESYFKWWEQQVANVNNEDLRAASAARRQQIRADFAKIDATYQSLRAAYTPFMRNLRDIQTVLGTSLTPALVTSVRPSIDSSLVQGAEVRRLLNELIAKYREVGVSLSAAPAK
jgi:hypothetical protein